MVTEAHKNYAEYRHLVADLLEHPHVLRLHTCSHHCDISRMQHCINVSYYSYRLGRWLGLDIRALARAGLLHDLFYYDARHKQVAPLRHAALHPQLALRNAARITPLSSTERDIIQNHMWLCGSAIPRCRESYLVSLVDKYSALYEAIYSIYHKFRRACCPGEGKEV